MRRYGWLAAWLLLLLALELAASPRLALGGVSPDWLLVLAVFIALRWPTGASLPAAWLLGLLADLLVGTRLGLFALGYMLVALVLGQIRVGAPRLGWPARAGVLFFAALAAHTVLAFAAAADGSRSPGRSLLLVLLIALYTGLIGPVLFWLLEQSSRALRLEA